MRLGSRDRIAGWLAMRLTLGTSTSAKTCGVDRVDDWVKMASVEVERGAQRTWRLGRSRTAVTRVGPGLMVWASKPPVAGLRVWASKPGRRFRGRKSRKDGM